MAELEASNERSPVRSSATQTDDEVPSMSRYVQIPPDIKPKAEGILLHGRKGKVIQWLGGGMRTSYLHLPQRLKAENIRHKCCVCV